MSLVLLLFLETLSAMCFMFEVKRRTAGSVVFVAEETKQKPSQLQKPKLHHKKTQNPPTPCD